MKPERSVLIELIKKTMFKKGQTPWNKGKKGIYSNKTIEKIRLYHSGKKLSEETKKKISESSKGRHAWNTGKKLSNEHKIKVGFSGIGRTPHNKGKIGIFSHSLKHRQKMSELMQGKNSPFWKGGVTEINKIIRQSLTYRLWRESVFKRDNYQCIWGGKEHGNKLHADHIKPFSIYPELRFAIDNGRTLCEDCHRKTQTWGGLTKFKTK